MLRAYKAFQKDKRPMSQGCTRTQDFSGALCIAQEVFSGLLVVYGLDTLVRFSEKAEGVLEINFPRGLSDEELEKVAYAALLWARCKQVLNVACVNSTDPTAESSNLRPAVCVLTQHPNSTIPRRMALGLRHIAVAVENFLLGGEEGDLRNVIEDVVSDLLDSRPLAQGFIDPVTNLEEFLEIYGDVIWELDGFPVSFACWFGVDMDGSSPEYINSRGIRRSDRVLRNFVIGRYQELLMTAATLLRQDANSNRTHVRGLIGALHRVHSSLEATRRGLRGVHSRDHKSYEALSNFLEDLDDVIERLGTGVLGVAERCTGEILGVVRSKAKNFGFHFIEFQPRLNANSVDPLIEQIYAAQCGATLPQEETARLKALQAIVSEPIKVDILGLATLSEVSLWIARCLDAFSAVQIRRCGTSGNRSCSGLSSFVLANCERNSTVLGFKWILASFSLDAQVIGLLESREALTKAGQLFSQRVVLEGRQAAPLVNFQGGSDTMRTMGMFAGWWMLYKAQLEVQESALRFNQPVEQYYGRADHPARWGGSLDQFVACQPSGKGAFHFLLQGSDKLPALLTYNIAESWLKAICSSVGADADPIRQPKWRKFMDRIAEVGTRAFHQLVYSAEFPVVMRRTMLFDTDIVRESARPLARGTSGAAADPGLKTWESRRAIATIQSGVVAGYVFQLMGSGAALSETIEAGGLSELKELYQISPFFRFFVAQLRDLYAQVDLENFHKLSEGLEDRVVQATFEIISKDTVAAIKALELVSGQPLESPVGLHVARVLRAEFVQLFQRSGWSLPQCEREPSNPSPMAALAGGILATLGTSG
jgi:phosphoenolpyruvate carboxylase